MWPCSGAQAFFCNHYQAPEAFYVEVTRSNVNFKSTVRKEQTEQLQGGHLQDYHKSQSEGGPGLKLQQQERKGRNE